MSMTLEYSPNSGQVHGAYEPITFVTSSTEQAGGTYFKFKYVADIYISNLDSPYTYVKQARIFIEPNSEGAGVFRIDKIISDYVAITSGDSSTSSAGFVNDTIHTLGSNSTTKIWVNNEGQNYRKVKVNYGQSYATTANKASLGTPSQFWVQRFIDKVTITVYPLPNATAADNFLNVYYVKRIQDAGAYTNASDTPFRFVPCMISGLSYYLSMKFAPQRTQEMKLLYEDELARALSEDGSAASTFITPKTYYPNI